MLSTEDLVRRAKSLLLTLSVNSTMAALVAAWPPLGAPVINFITKFIVEKILNTFLDYSELGAFILNTKFMVSDQAKEFRYAIGKEKLLESQGASKEVIEKAERESNEAFTRLIRYRP